MTTTADRPVSVATLSPDPSARRKFCWLGPVLAIALIAAFFVQVFAANILVTPWYLPIGGTLAAIVAFWTVGRSIRWWRLLIAGFCLALAALEWAFVLAGSRLPQYTGPAAPGTTILLLDGEGTVQWFHRPTRFIAQTLRLRTGRGNRATPGALTARKPAAGTIAGELFPRSFPDRRTSG